MSFFEWLGRVIMLVLAGMITLSIIGAIAAIPSGSLPQAIRVGEREPIPQPEQQPAPMPLPRETPETSEAVGASMSNQVVAAPAAPEPVDPAEWLEAIFYALLALVGIAALATLILWRMLHQRRRAADALELIALSRSAPATTPSPPSRASPAG
jgi:hypothetical protein